MASNIRSVMTGAVCSAFMIVGFSGQALAAGSKTGSAARLAEARAAYESALEELRAAEAELVTETENSKESTETARASSGVSAIAAQPEGEPGFFDWNAWEKSVDVGINGASGNSENLNLRILLGAERNTDKMETSLSALYRLTTSDGDETENRFRFDIRNDWLPPEGSKIRWWAQGSYEFDEFQEWDSRVSGAAGIGYEIIKNDKHTLIGRLGFGGSQTFGDMDEDFRPEAVAGLDYTWNIKDGQQFTAGTEVFLDVSETENFRANSYAQYEVLLDAESNLTFKTGIAHRYDSEPGATAERSDVEYYASMGWKF
ncbi:MAG: YdiY family protein [Phycisphaerales bacterium]